MVAQGLVALDLASQWLVEKLKGMAENQVFGVVVVPADHRRAAVGESAVGDGGGLRGVKSHQAGEGNPRW